LAVTLIVISVPLIAVFGASIVTEDLSAETVVFRQTISTRKDAVNTLPYCKN